MPLSTSIFQEGLIIPPVKIVAGGDVVPDIMVQAPLCDRRADPGASRVRDREPVGRGEACAGAIGIPTTAMQLFKRRLRL